MPVPDHDADERIVWQGDYITAKTRGRWEYVGRPRNIRAAVILAVDDRTTCCWSNSIAFRWANIVSNSPRA